MNKEVFICSCGKLCLKRTGLTNHQSSCEVAKKSKSEGKPPYVIRMIEPIAEDSDPDVAQFVELSTSITVDLRKDGNISAARRARTNLVKLRNLIIPLRKKILGRMK